MIKRYNPCTKEEEKCTPNQKAKQIILDSIQIADYWQENSYFNSGKMTEKEIEEISKYITKQQDRLRALLSPEFYTNK